jgi:hypothetical protein
MTEYELAEKLIPIIANPENRTPSGKVDWNFVESDYYMDFENPDSELFDKAVDLIIEAATMVVH